MGGAGGAANARYLIPVVICVVAALAAAPFARGALALLSYEGDALHLADMAIRIGAYGQTPHRDFMTPIGDLSLWPIGWFVGAGLGFGHAFLAAQAAAAAVLTGPALRVALSRFPGWTAWVYALYTLGLCIALLFGGTDPTLGVSMHYNRWAWALAYVALPLAFLAPLGPQTRAGRALDGALIGLAFAALTLVKVTYVAAFAPVALIALIARRQGLTLVVAFAVGTGALALATGALGLDFWRYYAGDLLAVARSETRAAPGDSFGDILSSPKYIVGTLIFVGATISLRMAGAKNAEAKTGGLLMLLMLPACAYVAYQNFGNDPQWLMLAGLWIFALLPRLGAPAAGAGAAGAGAAGRPARALFVIATAALALAAGPAINLMVSPLRALATRSADLTPLLPARPEGRDLLVKSGRLFHAERAMPWDGPGAPFAAIEARFPKPEKTPEPAMLNGAALPECTQTLGLGVAMTQMAEDLTAAGYAGRSILVADLFPQLWLFGDLKPVEGAAPWYYGGTPGLSHADYVLVPTCPGAPDRRRIMLAAIQKAGWTLTEARRTETYILLRPSRP